MIEIFIVLLLPIFLPLIVSLRVALGFVSAFPPKKQFPFRLIFLIIVSLLIWLGLYVAAPWDFLNKSNKYLIEGLVIVGLSPAIAIITATLLAPEDKSKPTP